MPLVSGIYLRALTGTRQRHVLVETWWIRWKLWWRGRGEVGGCVLIRQAPHLTCFWKWVGDPDLLLISTSISCVMTNFSGDNVEK